VKSCLPALVAKADDELLSFIASSFRSVWALELLLKSEGRAWARSDLIAHLRASDLVVANALAELVAAGFASVDEDGACYRPATDEVGRSLDAAEKLYRSRPNAVRRAIIAAGSSSATAFADAFKLRKE
jgi:hypothetical protein